MGLVRPEGQWLQTISREFRNKPALRGNRQESRRLQSRSRILPVLKHDPEKWTPVFGKDHAPPKRLERDDDSEKRRHALGRATQRGWVSTDLRRHARNPTSRRYRACRRTAQAPGGWSPPIRSRAQPGSHQYLRGWRQA